MKLKHLESKKYLRWLTLIVIFLLLFLRRPDAFTNSQFWAEDGSQFFRACFEGNINLFTPHPDTIQLIPRIISSLASFAPLYYIPYVYIYISALITLFVAFRITGERWHIPFKPLLALLIVLVPHSGEVFLNITNLQWITAILILHLALQENPENRFQAVTDLIILIMVGLTGAFILFFFPITLYRISIRGKNTYNYLFVLTSGTLASIQAFNIFRTYSGYFKFIDVDVDKWLSVFAYKFAGALIFRAGLYKLLSRDLIFCASFLLFIFILISIKKCGYNKQIVIFMASALLISVVTYLRNRQQPVELIHFNTCDRYFYLPRLMLIWSLIVFLKHNKKYIRLFSLIILIIVILNSAFWFRGIKYNDYNWKYYSQILKNNPKAPLSIPINPEWFVTLNKDNAISNIPVKPIKSLRMTCPEYFYYNTILLSWTPIFKADHYRLTYIIGGEENSSEISDNWFRFAADNHESWEYYVDRSPVKYRITALDKRNNIIDSLDNYEYFTCLSSNNDISDISKRRNNFDEGMDPGTLRLNNPPDFYYNTLLFSWTPIREVDHYIFTISYPNTILHFEVEDCWFKLIFTEEEWNYIASIKPFACQVMAIDNRDNVIVGPTRYSYFNCN